MHRPHLLVLSISVLTLLLAGCAGDPDSSPAPLASSSPSAPRSTANMSTSGPSVSPGEIDEPPTADLTITIAGDRVGPNAEELTVQRGEAVTIAFDTDRAGELHVHSSPEQYVAFEAGQSTKRLVIDAPGSVQVEEHASEIVVAIIQVR